MSSRKMLFSIAISWCLISLVISDSLVNLLPNLPGGSNIVFHAVLRDMSSGDEFFLEEYISTDSSSVTRGKIEIESKTDSSQIHHSTDLHNERLVLQGTSCDLYTYKSGGWDKKLPGVTKPLLNLILTMGPSLIYRIRNLGLKWIPIDAAEVRGVMMNGTKATVSYGLQITYYYKNHLTPEIGLIRPERIIFEGKDPGSLIWGTTKEKLIMEIYLHEDLDYSIAPLVQITPGIGCPFYLAQPEAVPLVKSHKVQTIMYQSVRGPSSKTSKQEIYVDDDQALMRLIKTEQHTTVDAIYDYNMGLIFIREDYGCLISPLGVNAPGMGDDIHYSLWNLFSLDKPYYYIGQVNYEHRPGFQAKAWEAVEHDKTISSGKYAKVVTTLYMAPSESASFLSGHDLIGVEINAYKKGSNGDYILVERDNRDYYDLKAGTEEEEFKQQFTLEDCFQGANERKELAFQISNRDIESGCNDLLQKRLKEFKNQFKTSILKDLRVSPGRLTNIEAEFSENQAKLITTFIEKPERFLSDDFIHRGLKLDKEALKRLSSMKTADQETCLKVKGSLNAPISNVIYCQAEQLCYGLERSERLVEDKDGVSCDVWDIPLGNLYRVTHELSLQDIHERMVSLTRYSSIFFFGCRYNIDNVLDVTPSAMKKDEFPFTTYRYGSKLISGSQPTTFSIPVKSAADCYRACSSSDQTICETFSYCSIDQKSECLLTGSILDAIPEERIREEAHCNIYVKNHFLDYHRIHYRGFKSQSSATIRLPLADCANYCYASEECFSFQYCLGSCSMEGFYTDSASEPREDCDIYIPKVEQNFEQVGSGQTVEETYHTELSISMEQCAALCYGWSGAGEKCSAFNFCPKGEGVSSCSLSSKMISDPGVKTKDSAICNYYQRKKTDQEEVKRSSNSEFQAKSTSSLGAFGMIVLFLISGLVIGLAAPIVYTKARSISFSVNRTMGTNLSQRGFGWSRQVNDADDNHTTI